MTPGARLQAVLELLEIIDKAPRVPADQSVSRFFRQRRYVGSKDRTAILHAFYGTLRYLAHLDEHIHLKGINLQGLDLSAGRRLRLVLFLAWKDLHSFSQISTWFSGAPYHPRPLTDLERGLIQGPFLSESALSLRAQGEIPSGLFPLFKEAFPEKKAISKEEAVPEKEAVQKRWFKEALALQKEGTIDIRVNLLKTTLPELQRLLELEGIFTSTTPWSPLCLRLNARYPLTGLNIFQEGLFEIQDEGSQLISFLMGALPGERIFDFCAGSGGKTLALSALMKNKGHIFACDTASWRLKRAKERLRRADVHNVSTHLLESHRDPWLKRHHKKMDRVLVDAPCSGTGTWRRHPEQRWRLRPEDVDRLALLQKEILESAARLVRLGGFLVYATCSLFPGENEKQIRGFLEKNKEFSLISLSLLWPPHLPTPCPNPGEDFLSLSPYRHGTDGFFCAVLRRETS